MPAVFVDKPVMKPAEQNQVVQVGGPTVGPVSNVVDLDPSSVGTSDPLAVSAVTMGYQSSQPAGDGPAVFSDTDHNTAVGDNSFENTVTGESPGCFVGRAVFDNSATPSAFEVSAPRSAKTVI